MSHNKCYARQVPEWVEEDLCQRTVVFTEAASQGLDGCVGENAPKNKSKFYADTDSFKAAVTEVSSEEMGRAHESLRQVVFHD